MADPTDGSHDVRRRPGRRMLALLALGILLGVILYKYKARDNVATYEWEPAHSAPRGCPIAVASSAFLHPGGSFYLPGGDVHKGWGKDGRGVALNPPSKPVPDQLDVTYYSYLEDQFYHGVFRLPEARIEQLFAEGYRDHRGVQTTYNMITAGMAPGGEVAVWLDSADRQVEVFFGQARAVDADWHKELRVPARIDREQRRLAVLDDLQISDPRVAEHRAHPPLRGWAGHWARYRTLYPWRPVFEGLPEPAMINAIDYYNGERDFWRLPLSEQQAQAERPIPSNIYFILPLREHRGRAYDITFHEQELLGAFQYLAQAQQPLRMVFRQQVIDGQTMFAVLLRNDDEEVGLKKLKREFYVVRTPD